MASTNGTPSNNKEPSTGTVIHKVTQCFIAGLFSITLSAWFAYLAGTSSLPAGTIWCTFASVTFGAIGAVCVVASIIEYFSPAFGGENK